MLPAGSLVIFDEAHRCGGETSQNSKMCALTKAYKLRTMLLSATLAESPMKMRALGYLVGWHNYRLFRTWLMQLGCRPDPWRRMQLSQGRALEVGSMLHNSLFPEFGVRVRIADIPGFPGNQVHTMLCSLGDAKAIDAAYVELAESELESSGNRMVMQLRARQKVELVKVKGMVELAMDAIADGMSPVVFVSFQESARLLHKKLSGSLVIGDQDAEDRARQVAAFQSNGVSSIVCTLGAGGVGLSLHDLQGGHPRISLICPSFNAVELRQALGRIHRAGSKSPALQYILYAAGTVEEKIRHKVEAKLRSLDIINDGDLEP